MKVASTRASNVTVSFKEAVFRGLAPDGGLYLPLVQPDLGPVLSGLRPDASMSDIARAAMSVFLADELDGESLDRIAAAAFPFRPELRKLDEGLYLLELFHGPTFAFKDFGACFLAAVMEEYLRRDRRRAVILTATSGDTGSAVASAFHGRAGIQVVILYPSGRVSPLQEKQLTTLGGNVAALEIDGSFDDCQRMVKAAFIDLGGRLGLTSANSINLGRLIPQAFYYIYGRLRLAAERPGGCVFCVPSGNFGNLTAGVLAWRWGLPVERFLAATNANKVVPEYLESGVFKPRPSVHTLSNAMDVGDPSNFERLEAIFGGDPDAMRAAIEGAWVSDEETAAAIRRWRRERGLFFDPHTALGVHAAERWLAGPAGKGRTVIALGTAHPGKFLEVVREAAGEEPPLPERLARVLTLEKKSIRMSNESDALKKWLLSSFA